MAKARVISDTNAFILHSFRNIRLNNIQPDQASHSKIIHEQALIFYYRRRLNAIGAALQFVLPSEFPKQLNGSWSPVSK